MSLTMDDIQAIVKPHNDKLIAEGRAAELLAALKRLLDGPPHDEALARQAARAVIAKTEGRTP